MVKEYVRNFFNNKLSLYSNEIKRINSSEEKTRLLDKFQNEIGPSILKETELFLEQKPISSILSLLEEASKSIENKDNIEMKAEIRFLVNNIGYVYFDKTESLSNFVSPTSDEKTKLVEEIESGVSVKESIKSIELMFDGNNGARLKAEIDNTNNRLTLFTGSRSLTKSRFEGYNLNKKIDIFAIADLLASRIANNDYFCEDNDWR